MSIGTFFKKVGIDLEKVLIVGAKLAQMGEPVVDVCFPAVGALYNSSVNEAVKLLTAGQTAALQGVGKPVQLANVVAAIEPPLIAYAQQQGLAKPTADHINSFTQAFLASMQVLIALENGQTPPTVTVTVAGSSQPITLPVAQLLPTPLAQIVATEPPQPGPGLHNVVPA